MTLRIWEAKVLSVPGAAAMVDEMESELRRFIETWLIEHAGGERIDMYAAFMADGKTYRVRSGKKAAEYTAGIWGVDGSDTYVAHCVSIVFSDGSEYRTAWQRIS